MPALRVGFRDLGFRMSGWGLVFRVQAWGFRVWGLVFKSLGLGFAGLRLCAKAVEV